MRAMIGQQVTDMIATDGKQDQENLGGGGATSVGALDMANGHDRQLLRSRRWSITDEKKEQYRKALDVALQLALTKKDRRVIVSCVRALAALELQNQIDEHLDHKYRRADAGKPTDVVDLRVYSLEFDRPLR